MEQIKTLFERYLKNECSPEEIKTLVRYFGNVDNKELLKSLIRDYLESSLNEEPAANAGMENLLNLNFNKIKEAISKEKKTTPLRVIPFHRRTWRLVAASVSILLLSATALFLFRSKKENIVFAKQNKVSQSTDIAPGNNNAMLTLDNGSRIMLDSAANGTLAQQGNTKVLKLNGQIAYNKTGDMDEKPVYNTITTANGNQYQLILTDGSKVWLNAASSIRFPASFIGNERKVEITGEAYFEVAKNPNQPFKVEFKNKGGEKSEIEVLGTHFNVNTYSEEPEIKTTLLEGSVKIKNATAVQMLSPGEQARLSSHGIEIKKDVDIEQVMAWKNGFFLFDNTDIYTLMRQVSRWYDVEVHFEGSIPGDGFSGKISRNVPLSKFLKVLEMNELHVRTEGRKITVTP